MREHQRVMRSQRLELVGRGDEGNSGKPGNLFGDAFGELRLGVEPGADGGAALCQRIDRLERQPAMRDAGLDLRRIAGEFLTERQWRRVLRVGTADLDDAGELLGLLVERLLQMR